MQHLVMYGSVGDNDNLENIYVAIDTKNYVLMKITGRASEKPSWLPTALPREYVKKNFSTDGCLPVLYLEMIYVPPKCRRRGIATSIVTFLLKAARAQGKVFRSSPISDEYGNAMSKIYAKFE